MFNRVKPAPQVEYKFVEVDRNTKLPELTTDLRESLKSLALTPAFQYLLQRFRIKKAAMESTLREGFKLDEQQIRYCQAGIYWSGEIERDIRLLSQDVVPTRTPVPDELEEFKKINRQIQLVGNQS